MKGKERKGNKIQSYSRSNNALMHYQQSTAETRMTWPRGQGCNQRIKIQPGVKHKAIK